MSFVIAIAIATAVASTATSDALSRKDDLFVSAEVMEECQLVIPGKISYRILKEEGSAAFVELVEQQELGSDPTTLEQKFRAADYLFKKRTEEDLRVARSLVTAQGCAPLLSHARNTLEAVHQH